MTSYTVFGGTIRKSYDP